jgi:hypothetical protein
MANAPGPSVLVIERILRDRDGIWRQISEDRDLRGLSLSMLTSSVISLAIYGLVLGSSNGFLQAISSMVKLPLLFLVTLAICLPTLYLFNLVFGARLSMTQAVALIMVAITVISVLTLAFAPISLFFLITAQSYEFFKLLNVCILVLTAIVGLRFLTMGMAALNRLHAATHVPVQATAEPFLLEPTVDGSVDGPGAEPGAVRVAPVRTTTAVARVPASAPLDPRPTSIGLVYIWIVLFGFVGTQLAWTLRPFFGDPDKPFALFRHISGTFYSDIFRTLGRLLG